MSWTLPVFQVEMSWLNAVAPKNTVCDKEEKDFQKNIVENVERERDWKKREIRTVWHACDAAGVPSGNVLIKCGRLVEHCVWQRRRRFPKKTLLRVLKEKEIEKKERYVLRDMLVTLETSHVPIPPYGLPVLSWLAANIRQDPSPVSERHASTAVFRAVLSAGVKDAFANCGVANSRKPIK